MSFLYLDSCERLQVGLIGDDFNWIELHKSEETKGSGIVHKMIFDLFLRHDLDVKGLSGIIQVSGPGSYTGMRLSEGMSQIFENEGIPVYSFYHFDVPYMLGVKSGAWISKAFKGEFFKHSWTNESTSKSLHRLDDIENILKDESNLYTHFEGSFERELLYTHSLIEQRGSEIFKKIVNEKTRKEPYYYRLLEDEFKVTQK